MNYYLGEIQLFAFNFPPMGWATCNGTLVPVSQSTALFSLLGDTYGGDGRTTFALPNLAARAACGQGAGPGLTNRALGDVFGDNGVSLVPGEMPAHSHAFTLWNQTSAPVRSNVPSEGAYLIEPQSTNPFPPQNAQRNGQFSPNMAGAAGQGFPHENRQPGLAMNYCIAFSGSNNFVFPS